MKKLKNVLLIDDSAATNNFNKRVILSQQLADNVVEKLNGQEAYDYVAQVAHEELPNLILLDINMPVLDGFGFLELYQALGEERKKSAVILMLTTSMSEEDRQKAEGYDEISDFLHKPLSIEMVKNIWTTHFQNN